MTNIVVDIFVLIFTAYLVCNKLEKELKLSRCIKNQNLTGTADRLGIWLLVIFELLYLSSLSSIPYDEKLYYCKQFLGLLLKMLALLCINVLTITFRIIYLLEKRVPGYPLVRPHIPNCLYIKGHLRKSVSKQLSNLSIKV